MHAPMRVPGLALLCLVAACGGDDSPLSDVTTENCDYQPMVPTAGAGGTVTAGPLTAGAAEQIGRAHV